MLSFICHDAVSVIYIIMKWFVSKDRVVTTQSVITAYYTNKKEKKKGIVSSKGPVIREIRL